MTTAVKAKGHALGRLVATPAALAAIRESVKDSEHAEELAQAKLMELAGRHCRGDWGDVPADDAKQNDASAKAGVDAMILSSYKLADGTKIWVITDAGGATTTVLLPDDY